MVFWLSWPWLHALLTSHGAVASRAVDVNLMQRQKGNQAVERAFEEQRHVLAGALVIAALNLP
jgi:hypothetical protein